MLDARELRPGQLSDPTKRFPNLKHLKLAELETMDSWDMHGLTLDMLELHQFAKDADLRRAVEALLPRSVRVHFPRWEFSEARASVLRGIEERGVRVEVVFDLHV